MNRKYKIAIVLLLAVFMLRICLSKDKKKEDNLLSGTSAAVPVVITPKEQTFALPVHPGIFGINIGFAFKRELDKDSGFVQLLRALHPNSLRFPGGTVANYYHPKLPVYGYKLGEIPPGLGTLFMEQSRRSENILYNFIRLAKSVNTGVVYCANVYTGTTAEVLFVIEELKKNNIPVLGVELGNEFCLMEYRNKFPNAKVYIDKIKATAAAVRNKYPDLKIVVIGGDGVPAGETNARSKFMRGWNDVMSRVNFYHAFTWHPYQDCPPCDNDAYFDNVYTKNMNTLAPQATNYLFGLGGHLMQQYGPNRKLWITEWNLGNLTFLDNTFLQGAYVFENFLTMADLNVRYNNYIEVTNLHSIDGLITIQKGKLKPLLSNGIDMATVQYYAFQFLASTMNRNTYRGTEFIATADTSLGRKLVCQSYMNKEEHKTYIYFVNRSGKKIQLTVNAPVKSRVLLRAIEAEFPYATAGKTYYEKDYPDKLKPVSYRDELLNSKTVTLMPYAFGYVTFSNE
jgi:hypothetical protein